jgi:hypothetical protein
MIYSLILANRSLFISVNGQEGDRCLSSQIWKEGDNVIAVNGL